MNLNPIAVRIFRMESFYKFILQIHKMQFVSQLYVTEQDLRMNKIKIY